MPAVILTVMENLIEYKLFVFIWNANGELALIAVMNWNN
jgi:hypothetical protein